MTTSNIECALLISSGNGPAECQIAVVKAIGRIAEEASQIGILVDVLEQDGSTYGPASAHLTLRGKGASELHASWLGNILWVCKSPVRPRHGRKNWFIEIFDATSSSSASLIDPRDVKMNAIRAGGPGGQHQNKTSSAIRAQWVSPAGKSFDVLVKDQRSQHQNRSTALRRLNELVSRESKEKQSRQASNLRQLHHEVARGAPSRTFRGLSFKETLIST